VILTALDVEYLAVKRHFLNLKEKSHKSSIYEIAKFETNKIIWTICLAKAGRGNSKTGIMTERVINYFKPNLVIFVGIAGGIKDVVIGDVVAVDKAYDYESAKISPQLLTRPEIGMSSYAILERAQKVADNVNWKKRIKHLNSKYSDPKIVFRSIATGDKVITSRKSNVFKLIVSRFNDAIAVETEAGGFYQAIRANEGIISLIIRGISDMIDDKAKTDSKGCQEIAADYASAFMIEVLYNFTI